MRLQKLLSVGMAFAVTFTAMTGCTFAAEGSNSGVQFDFTKSDSRFTPIFADYPYDEGVEEFYELRHSYGVVPIPGAGNGIFISGNNHSDDLFMGYVKKLDGFVPSRTYHFTMSFKLATSVESNLVGVGGAPGESVAVKCGITPTEPMALVEESGGSKHYRMNLDKGRQGNSGKEMVVVGDMAKKKTNRPGEYEFKKFQAEFDVAANARGEVFLIIGTDSGFEATTSYYLDDISVRWKNIPQPAVTRAEAAQMLFDAADRPSADVEDCPFKDVDPTVSYAEAVAWVQQNGYLTGYKNGRFGPENTMTVEKAMVMVYNFFGKPSINSKAVLKKYKDRRQISTWAEDAVAWSIKNGLLKANANRKISPKSKITKEKLAYAINQIVVAG